MNKDTFKRNGNWKVTTEGDVEGRTTKHLGVYAGNIDEIALALATKCCYKLTFESMDKKIDLTPSKSEVHIEVVGVNQYALIKILKEELNDKNLRVEKSNFYNGVLLTMAPKENPEQAMIRKLKEAGFDPREVIQTFRQR